MTDPSLLVPRSTAGAGLPIDLKSASDGRANHFNLIRVLAALGVLYSHCFELTGRPEPLVAAIRERTLLPGDP
jgi:hypothetical protein